MKRAIVVIAVAGFAAVGCQKKGTSSVTEISPSPSAYQQPANQPAQPTAVQPVIYDTPQTTAMASSGNSGATGTISGGTYIIKKGDTLYSIAKAKYGTGSQWQKIASANPGINPSGLKVGQTITLP